MLRTAADLMQKKIVTIYPTATLQELALLLDEEGIHGVPVVDASGNPLGVVSRTDLSQALSGGGEVVRDTERSHYYAFADDEVEWEGEITRGESGVGGEGELTVAEIMSARIIKATASTSAGALARLMLRERVQRVLILAGRRLIGLVSASDVLRCVAEYENRLKKSGEAPAARTGSAAAKTVKASRVAGRSRTGASGKEKSKGGRAGA